MFDPGRLFGRGWIPHGSPLWPSLATADPAKVTKYNLLPRLRRANSWGPYPTLSRAAGAVLIVLGHFAGSAVAGAASVGTLDSRES